MSAVLPHLEITPQRPHWLAGAPGFEPGNGGIKIRCPTTCLRAKARAIGSLFLLAAKLSERRRLRGRLITLVSDQDELAIVLRGDLAAILRFAAGKEKPRHPFGGRVLDALLSQKSVVAGARNARFLRLVERTIPRLGVAYKSVQIASCRLDNGAWSPGGDYLPKRDRHCMFKPEIHTIERSVT